jgi:hypothetical protein
MMANRRIRIITEEFALSVIILVRKIFSKDSSFTKLTILITNLSSVALASVTFNQRPTKIIEPVVTSRDTVATDDN